MSLVHRNALSARELAARRRNAQNSTGPRPAERAQGRPAIAAIPPFSDGRADPAPALLSVV